MAKLTRERIIETAVAIVEREGHETMSFRGLARHMGVTAPALYDHVDSKDDVLRSVAAHGYVLLVETFDVEGERAIDRCRARAVAYIDFAARNPELFRVMFSYRPAAVAIEVDNELDAANDTFEVGLTDLRCAIDDGDLAPRDPEELNLILWAAVHGVATVSLTAPPVAEQVGGQVIDAIFRGLAP